MLSSPPSPLSLLPSLPGPLFLKIMSDSFGLSNDFTEQRGKLKAKGPSWGLDLTLALTRCELGQFS